MDTKKRKKNSIQLFDVNTPDLQQVLVNQEGDYVISFRLSDIGVIPEEPVNREVELKFDRSDITSDVYIRIVLDMPIVMTLDIRVLAPLGVRNIQSKLDMKALILNENAQITFVPSLEIDEMDVSVDHKSSVGAPNLEWQLYMKSRGYSDLQVGNILSDAFVEAY